MTSKEKYRELCETETSISFFSQPWWLDAAVGDIGWDVALVEEDGEIHAALPYVKRRRFGMVLLTQPTLTPSLGPWIRQTQGKNSEKNSNEKRLTQSLIQALPRFDKFNQRFNCNITNWLPFYWAGFSQTTRYTYILPDVTNHDHLWKGLRENIRGDIRKASRRFEVSVRSDLSILDFIAINKKTFDRQGIRVPYSDDYILRLDSICEKRQCRKFFIASDASGNHHAGVYIVWDRNCAYYIMGGSDRNLRMSGAMSLCLWEAIKFTSTVAQGFDFEGSMIEPIERFFRAFGAEQKPYFAISKSNSKILDAYDFVQRLFKHQ